MAYMEHGERPLLKMPAKNATGSTIPANRIVTKTSSDDDYGVALPSADTDPVYGVTDRAIADLDTGNVTVQGVVNIECASAVTAKDKVTTDTSGKAVTWTAGGGRALVGVALTTTTTSGQLVLVALTGPGAYGIS